MNNFSCFKEVGSILFRKNLISMYGGNLSIRKKDTILITASGSRLENLKQEDIIENPIEYNKNTADYARKKKPSVEIPVHRSIYLNTRHKAIVHAHPQYAVVLSFNRKKIIPIDSEGCYFIKEVPVLSVESDIGSKEVAEKIPYLLNKSSVVLIRKHGVFAASDTLLNACSLVVTLELSAQIIYKKSLINNTKL